MYGFTDALSPGRSTRLISADLQAINNAMERDDKTKGRASGFTGKKQILRIQVDCILSSEKTQMDFARYHLLPTHSWTEPCVMLRVS